LKESLLYSLKIWLTVIVISPIVAGLIQMYIDPEIYSFADVMVGLCYCIPAGLIFCLPSWLILWFLIRYLNKKELKMYSKKLYFTIASLFISILPFFIINPHTLLNSGYWPSILPWLISYSGVLIICIWLYRLRIPSTKQSLEI
jgi:hypothetical protein